MFSGLRVAEPEKDFERVVDLLQDLADKAGPHGLIIGLENDRACNIATAQEMAGVLAAIDHSNLQVVWDPAARYISGEKPFPIGLPDARHDANRACAREGLHARRPQAGLGALGEGISTGRARSMRWPKTATTEASTWKRTGRVSKTAPAI